MNGNITKLGLTLCITLLAAAGILAADKPAFDVDWYGYFKLDASYDQNVTSHGNYAMWVNPQQDGRDDEQFNMTHKQTCFGFTVEGKGYRDVSVTGKLEVDLYGGGNTENDAILLLRHAFFTVQSGTFRLQAGQTWDMIAPLNPSTLNYPVLWGCGNPGYRRPQVSLWYTAEPNTWTNVTIAGGFFRTIGSDLTPTISLAAAAAGETNDGQDDGIDAGIPSFQGILDFERKLASGGSIRFGASGLWGQLKAETNLGNFETYESWGAFGHFAVSPNSQYGFLGEVFSGVNLATYNAGILEGNKINGVRTKGGWASLWIKPSPKVRLAAGGGLDDPDDADLGANSRARNQSIFGNIEYSPVSQVTLGLELSQWETTYKDAEVAKNLRVQSSFVLNF